MSEDSESFSMADYFDRDYDRTWLFYKFTIRNAEGCTLNMKTQQNYSCWLGIPNVVRKNLLEII